MTVCTGGADGICTVTKRKLNGSFVQCSIPSRTRYLSAQVQHTLTRDHTLLPATHTHTHTHLTAIFPGLPRWAGTRKVKPIWILLKQETVSGSGISWVVCMSALRSRQITMPGPHHSSFFTGRMPFLPPNQQRQSTEGTFTCHSHIYPHPRMQSIIRLSLILINSHAAKVKRLSR